MGRKLDVLLRRTFKTSKLKSLLGLTVTRLAVLKNLRRVRYSQARGDVTQLLQLGHEDRALLRAEFVIKEQNMLDVFAMVEGYCHVLMERAILLDHQKDCPDELREAVTSLIFAASRSADMPELQEARAMFAARFGKEFVTAAVELRNNCGVNGKMIQKMSTKQPSLENRVAVAKGIALENGIAVNLPEPSSETAEEKKEKSNQPMRKALEDDIPNLSELGRDEHLTESMKRREKYKDVASAAQAAFESAAHAASAARAAVELSRSESLGKGSDDDSSPRHLHRNNSSQGQERNQGGSSGKGLIVTKTTLLSQTYGSKSEDEQITAQASTVYSEEPKHELVAQLHKSASALSSDSGDVRPRKGNRKLTNELGSGKMAGKEVVFEKYDDDTEEEQCLKRRTSMTSERTQGLDKDISGKNEWIKHAPPYQKPSTIRYQDDLLNTLRTGINQMELRSENEDTHVPHYAEERVRMESKRIDSGEKLHSQLSAIGKRPVSMRTRRSVF